MHVCMYSSQKSDWDSSIAFLTHSRHLAFLFPLGAEFIITPLSLPSYHKYFLKRTQIFHSCYFLLKPAEQLAHCVLSLFFKGKNLHLRASDSVYLLWNLFMEMNPQPISSFPPRVLLNSLGSSFLQELWPGLPNKPLPPPHMCRWFLMYNGLAYHLSNSQGC
jgi:hypothetical protein